MPQQSPFASLATQLIHAGEPRPRFAGEIVSPIFQSATFAFGGQSDYHDITYIRLNNTPNHHALHDKLATLEGGEAALVASSGMAAITSTLLALLNPGDHIIAQNCLYGGTVAFISHELGRLGIAVDYVDPEHPEEWEAKLRPTTKLFYAEGITNPLMQLGDIQAIAAFSRQKGLICAIDNTFATPVLFRPLSLGFDLVLHSCTKYLNGHTDIVAGAVIGKRALVKQIKAKLDLYGGSLDPHACFLLQRGLKTLQIRVERQSQNALDLARFLKSHAAVSEVYYPGLETHPHYNRARSLFQGGFGGMLAVELHGGVEAANSLMSKLHLATQAPSLGGVETLITRPATTSHAGLSPSERARLGISDGLIRISVGLEGVQDLISDFGQAL